VNLLEECLYKADKVRAMVKEKGFQGIIIRKQPNFSWISAGGRGFIGLASETACAALVVTPGGVYLAGNNIEVPRLLAEELPRGFAEAAVIPWREDGNLDQVLKNRFGNLTTDTAEDPWFRAERVTLLKNEEDRFAELGKAAAAGLEDVCLSLKRGRKEWEIAGMLAEKYWAEGIEPITLLVAADERSERVRHYVPTAKEVGDGVICSVCARKSGLVVSATRTVAFKKDFAGHYEKLLQVERAAFDALHPGSEIGDVFKAMMDAYGRNGLPGEWENHHQGGLTAYLAREIRAWPECSEKIKTRQAFAWNPSAAGAKCEDTVFLGENGLRFLTDPSPSWPAVSIGEYRRPDILRRW
jgi:Xaa-Pro aminopeptidase